MNAYEALQKQYELEASLTATREQLEENARISQALRDRLWQYQGQKDAQGHRDELEQELQRLHRRIAGLKQTQSALLIAQDTLTAARQELQRREPQEQQQEQRQERQRRSPQRLPRKRCH